MRITIQLDTEQAEDSEHLTAILSALNGEHECRQNAYLAELRAALTGHGHDVAPVPGPVEPKPAIWPELGGQTEALRGAIKAVSEPEPEPDVEAWINSWQAGNGAS